MASPQVMDSGTNTDPANSPSFRGLLSRRPAAKDLGWLNGSLIGLALVLGVWGWEAIRLITIPVPLRYPSLITAGLLLIVLCGFTGWLTSRFNQVIWVLPIWLVTGIVAALVVAFQPTFGRTLTIWLVDRRFWGVPVYPYSFDSLLPPILAGFFIILMFCLLAVLQNYRLEAASPEVNENGRLQVRAWFILLLPLPFVLITGVVTRAVVGDPSSQALQSVYQAIEVVRVSEGDLFALGLQQDLNYSALNSVREQLSADYTLGLGEIDQVNSITYVVAHFADGAWINCRILNEDLSFCFDAVAPYTVGLSSLITGEELPATCMGCLPRVSAEQQAWLLAQGENFAGAPQVERVAQWGGNVLMRAEAGDYAISCWFEGISPVQLASCFED